MAVTLTSNLNMVIKATDEQLAKAAEVIGGTAERYAKQRCPTKTSNLKNSITHSTKDNGHTVVIGTNVEYAPYVELGHHQQPGRYVPAIGKRLKRDWVPPKPFLRPAFEDHLDEYKTILTQILSE